MCDLGQVSGPDSLFPWLLSEKCHLSYETLEENISNIDKIPGHGEDCENGNYYMIKKASFCVHPSPSAGNKASLRV